MTILIPTQTLSWQGLPVVILDNYPTQILCWRVGSCEQKLAVMRMFFPTQTLGWWTSITTVRWTIIQSCLDTLCSSYVWQI